ncbi:MarR family transcriptional regulator [Pelotomaculum isophthalicicum JI]|uniref:MarR family transcriptional regulator n=1 Tax=Pelotomaculum isophthalicicum JI TaxID=947010 RepID=A0A9X4GZ73_9FIRM|nr:MarR family transcriptional regulator [Pelotomaculum isophthalicicum]MDF9408422.1 MarR family transcriptional regulator [Pelotomaculum isophthalicicum JI]
MDEKTILAQELARTMFRFKRLGWRQDSTHALRQSEFILLATITHSTSHDSDGIKISDLSARLQITPAGVTHIINSLEEGGYVERLADPADRRVVLVKPTGRGNQAVNLMNAKFLETLKELINYLGERDSKELIRLLSSALTFIKERRNCGAEKFKA